MGELCNVCVTKACTKSKCCSIRFHELSPPSSLWSVLIFWLGISECRNLLAGREVRIGKNCTLVFEYGSRPRFFSAPPIRPRPANDVQILVLNFKSGVRVRLTFREHKKSDTDSRFKILPFY